MLVSIANLIIDIQTTTDIDLTTSLKDYIIDEGTPDLKIKLSVNDNIPLPTEELYGPYKFCYYSKGPDGAINTYTIPEGIGRCTTRCSISADCKMAEAEVWDLTELLIYFNLEKSFVNVIGQIFLKAILKKDGFVLHGSSISYNQNGIIFSAKSGTGKSTQTGLWMKEYPDVIMVNDDTPAITFEGDKVYLNGTPFAGSTGFNTNVKVPLKAIVFLERAKEPYIEKLSFRQAIPRFMDEMKKSLVSENISECIDYAAKVMEKVPVYLLHCNMEKESVMVLKNELGL